MAPKRTKPATESMQAGLIKFLKQAAIAFVICVALLIGLAIGGSILLVSMARNSPPPPASQQYMSPSSPIRTTTPSVTAQKPEKKPEKKSDVIHVEAYTRKDGTKVKAHTRKRSD